MPLAIIATIPQKMRMPIGLTIIVKAAGEISIAPPPKKTLPPAPQVGNGNFYEGDIKMRRNIMKGTFLKATLTNGDTQTFSMLGAPLPATVWVIPASGDTVAVSVSFDGVNFSEWELGAVTKATADSLISGVHSIRFQRTAGSGTTSTCGVS